MHPRFPNSGRAVCLGIFASLGLSRWSLAALFVPFLFSFAAGSAQAQGTVTLNYYNLTQTSLQFDAVLDSYRESYRNASGGAEYRIRAQIQSWSGPDTYVSNFGTDTSWALGINGRSAAGLQPGATYLLHAWAERTTNGGGSWSFDGGRVEFFVTTINNPPDSPTIRMLDASDSQITATFNAPNRGLS